MRTYVTLLIACLSGSVATAQAPSFTGTYVNPSSTIALRFKLAGGAYHGLLQTDAANFAMEARASGPQLSGTIYAVNGPVPFSAVFQNGSLVFSAFGYTEPFQQTSPEHGLDGVDLTAFFNAGATAPATPPDPNADYDYSYAQQSTGQATEQRQANPEAGPLPDSPYPALQDAELRQLVAGSQVVYYTRTSYLSDNVASSITYVNFCPDGRFWVNYDGSFSVEGNYGGNAQGATYGRNSGRWQLVDYQGQPAVFLAYRNGNTAVNPLNKERLLQGRWRIGNTKYAVQRNKVVCP